VIKSYHSGTDAEGYFEAEVKAFGKLNEGNEPVPNLIGFHGAFSQNDTFHVVLEYANIGTLEDHFAQVSPPRQGQDILSVWKS
jgi:hypothetical protein